MRGAQAVPYELVSELGQGGMAIVYRARDARNGREVALKVIKPDFLHNNPDALRRFQIEIEVVSHLEHPHIVPIVDYQFTQQPSFIAMRLLRGGSLKDRIKPGPLSLPEMARYIGHIAEALDYAHQQGVIHRDIKPSNILLDDTNPINAYVTDFGVARIIGHSGQTQTGAYVGTFDYMAPEQWDNAKMADARSDVYALGVILFELATGKPPFTGQIQEIMVGHFKKPVPEVARALHLPAAFDDILQTALAKAPEARYPTAGTLAADLRALAPERPTTASTAPAPPRYSTQPDSAPLPHPKPEAAPQQQINFNGRVNTVINEIKGDNLHIYLDGRKDNAMDDS